MRSVGKRGPAHSLNNTTRGAVSRCPDESPVWWGRGPFSTGPAAWTSVLPPFIWEERRADIIGPLQAHLKIIACMIAIFHPLYLFEEV
ncbi:unnamed protein product [Arctogadus glacialis]